MQVAREEKHLRAYAILIQVEVLRPRNTTDDAQLNTSAVQETINTVAALAEKATESEGATFIVTVKPKHLRLRHDFQAIKKEVTESGVFLTKDGK